ncbi:penicillin-binding protein 2 [Hazenella sp. IB182353]|uniref:peptidoglycan D,D-transpeptidase FtsI family protein n=1 Tax=Polycladospora coralii TaxID=2771432 RepID=UPI001747A7F5|nr:penicillin-binding protein 2 [Polycladospora coralii]MBS7530018.1 penicillin-binding protein 2 [Polycladospora coralii]
MSRWRTWLVTFAFVLFFACLIMRLYVIQISSPRSLSVFTHNQTVDLVERAHQTQTKEVIIDSGRGKILDRNGEALAGELDTHLLIFPHTQEQINVQREKIRQLAVTLSYSEEKLIQILSTVKKPYILSSEEEKELVLSSEQVSEIEKLALSGIEVVQSDHRLAYHQIGKHILGQLRHYPALVTKLYPEEVKQGQISIDSLVGVSGLEYTFDSFLHGSNENILHYTTDANGTRMNGIQIKVSQNVTHTNREPLTIKTTLDKDIQFRVEEAMRNEKVLKGVAVVQEIKSGNIVAIASYPTEQTIDTPLRHGALTDEIPGSIFKMVVAAAALNEGVVKPDTKFRCDGNLDGALNKHEHHGDLTFKTAFAKSCNVVLGTVAKQIGAEKLEAYAKRFGLAQPIMWQGQVKVAGYWAENEDFSQIERSQEEPGIIFSETGKENIERGDQNSLARTGIGQQDVQMTPLQASNMVTALFHQGKAPQPRLVTEILDEEGKVRFAFKPQNISGAKGLKADTISNLKKMMRMVVTDGTATPLRSATWSLAGKTGTAQREKEADGTRNVNRWIIGYGPTQAPQYAMSIVLLDVEDANDPRGLRIFQSVFDRLAELEKKNKENKSATKNK